MSFNLEKANRESGNWLPGIKNCRDRLRPCGKARCMDWAMLAAEYQNGNTYEGDVAAGDWLTKAASFARECSGSYNNCPLGRSAEGVVYNLFDLQTR